MTLLIGILCTDGAVIAADRQATHGHAGQPTVAQPVSKVTPIGGNILFAASGHIGLGQQLTAEIRKRAKELRNQPYRTAIKHIQSDFRAIIDPAFNTAQLAAGVYGPGAAAEDATCGGLLAAQFKDGLKLVEIKPQVSVEHLTEDLSFVSMGSGKFMADAFLGFLKDAFGSEKTPTVRGATLAAFWTVKHAIKMKITGVGYDVDVFVLEPKEKDYVARQLPPTDLFEHQDFIDEAESCIRELADKVSGKGTYTEEPPPTTNSS